LDEAEIARAHGVSRTPVREALLALAQEGLVVIRPQSGTFVSLIDGDALPEAIEARRALEELAARRAAERRPASDLFRPSLKAAREAAKVEDVEAFHMADDAFHQSIYEAGETPIVGRLARALRAQVDRYRRLTLPQPGRMRRVAQEHEEIAQEILRGEPKAAARAMRRHLAALHDDVAATRAARPEMFLPPGAGV
jgi:DNA-binding GntR family transcriptional regulator